MLRVALRRGQQRHRHLRRDPILDGENKDVLVLNLDTTQNPIDVRRLSAVELANSVGEPASVLE